MNELRGSIHNETHINTFNALAQH